MKTLFKVLVLGILLAVFSALAFAQDTAPTTKPDLGQLFEQFKKEIKAPCGERDAAHATGKTIIDNFGNDELNKDIIEFVKKKMADIEKNDPACKRNNRYNKAFKDKNWPEFFAAGKDVIAAEGDNGTALDVTLDLVSVGYDRAAVDKIDTYNNDTLNYAKTALQKVDAGKTSQTGKYGVFVPFNTKEEAQSWLNYIIAWEMYNKMSQKKDALPYYYKVTQINGSKQKDFTVYTNIGQFYYDEAQRIFNEYTEKRKANNNEDNDELKQLLGLSRGNADRAIDAFGRAVKFVPADNQQAKTAINGTLNDLYKFRFNQADAKQADVDKYVATLTAKPMPDPSTAVTPVVEEVKPATTTSTNSTTPTTTTTPAKTTTTPAKMTTTPTNTKSSTTTKQPTSSTTNTTSTESSTEAKTTPAKKPVTKKKGTR